jgi:hypothetical protein
VIQKTWLKTKDAPQWDYDSSSVSWTSGTEYLIQSRATDEIDHVELPSKWIRFIFDTEKPSSIVVNPADGAYLNQVNIITGNSTDPGGSGLDSVELTIKRKSDNTYWNGEIWDLDIRWLTVEGTSEWILDSSLIPWTSDTYYAVSPRAIDSAGNDRISGPGNSFMFDDTPPTQTVSINDEAVYTNLTSVELSLSSFDSGSGVSQMAFSNNGVDWSAWEPIKSTKAFNLTGGDGSKIIYYKAQDRAGNTAKPAAGVIILDTTPPVSLVRINDNAAFTNSRDISLTLTATDILSDITNMSFSFDQTAWTLKMPFNDFKTLTLPAGDGNKIVYFRVEDKAGNVAIVTDSILLDTTPPHSLSIIMENGAVETKSTNISLKVNALDDISGVAEMSFCTLVKPWSEWEEYTKSKPYEITSGRGEKTIFFKVKDKAGNEAPPVSVKINLNVTFAGQTQTTEDAQTFLNFWNVLIIVIMIIIILCIVAVISKRRKRAKLEVEQKLALEQAKKEKAIPPVTPDLIEAPVSATGQVAPAPSVPQLPAATVTSTQITTTSVGVQQPQTMYSTIPEQASMAKPIPQLPPSATQQQPRQPRQIQPPTLTPTPTPSTTEGTTIPAQTYIPAPTTATTATTFTPPAAPTIQTPTPISRPTTPTPSQQPSPSTLPQPTQTARAQPTTHTMSPAQPQPAQPVPPESKSTVPATASGITPEQQKVREDTDNGESEG